MRNQENLYWTWILIRSSLMPVHLSGRPNHPYLRFFFIFCFIVLLLGDSERSNKRFSNNFSVFMIMEY